MDKILIVDDEPSYRKAIKGIVDWRALELSPPDEAINGVDALQKIRAERYDLVITDIKMPRMDGLTLIKEAARVCPSARFIVLSAYDEFAMVKEAFQSGVVDYILKHQISREELFRVIGSFRRRKNDKEHSERVYVRSTILNILHGFIPEADAAELLSLPPAEQGGRIYPAAALIHPGGGAERAPEGRLVSEGCEEAAGRFEALYLEAGPGRRVSLFLLSERPLNWRELDRFWRRVLDFWQERLLGCGGVMSLGFSHNVRSLTGLRSAMSEAEFCLGRFLFRGKGALLSPPKVMTEQGPPRPLPSSGHLAKALTALDPSGAAGALRSMKLGRQACRDAPSEAVTAYYGRVNAHIVSALEGADLSSGPEIEALLLSFARSEGWDLGDYNDYLEGVARYIEGAGNLPNKQVAELVRFIRRHYDRELTLSLLAERFGLNPSYLSRLFTREVGTGLASYLASVRIEEAERLLAEGRLKVSEVGVRVGIPQPETFCRTFKRLTGVSPQQYIRGKSKKPTDRVK